MTFHLSKAPPADFSDLVNHHECFRFSKTIHKQLINRKKLLPLNLLYVY